jgi:hypothetical protein
MHGNALYEWSQLLAAAGDASWRGVLDEATALFRAAGCAEKDIRGALKNHTEVGRGGGEGVGVAGWWWEGGVGVCGRGVVRGSWVC